jgi:hypothetical protein
MNSNAKNAARRKPLNPLETDQIVDANDAEAVLSNSRVRYRGGKRLRVADEVRAIRKQKRLAKFHLKNKSKKGPKVALPSAKESPVFNKFVKWFVEPLFSKGHFPSLPATEKLDILFNTHTRDIVPAVVCKYIKMPGNVWTEDGGLFRPPTVSEANFPVGTPVFVRIDDMMPNRIDIESCEKPGLVFWLTSDQYKTIIDSLKEILGCNYRLDPPNQIRNADGTYSQLISKPDAE